MSFVNAEIFWVLFILFVFISFIIFRKKESLTTIFEKEVLKRLSVTDESISTISRHLFMMVSIFLMIVAMARPVMQKGDKTVEIEGLTLLTALDISGSMRSKDVYPNRLTFAKKKMNAFFDAMPSDEIGVMAFAYSPFILAPFSSDKETLKMMVEGVDDSYISMGSTDFSALGELASRLLEKKDPKVLVLFTDGGDEEAIAGFADILKESKIDLYVVLVGTKKGAPVIGDDGKPYTLKDGTIAITQRNDILGELAKENAGAYVVATNGKEDITQLISVIRTKYKNQEQAKITVKERVEYFYYPLGLGLLFLLISFSSMPKRRQS